MFWERTDQDHGKYLKSDERAVTIPTRGITWQACVISPFEPNTSICQHTDTGLILQIAVSVNAIGRDSISQRTARPPIKSLKTMDVKKPGKPSQVNRVKISCCFLNVSGLARISRN
ncbi:hypothetical protein DUA64_11950 [Salmonella enterica subsp. enterica serovar Abony]|nr:hypothetical protein [Salmonella enterica subsp. enterica serovar Abony]EBY6398846.1 hypothetical protein [Salmonella enterica subsp. enterica serovar Abony]